MKGIIWYHTKEKGKEFFNLIKEQYDRMGYECEVLASSGHGVLPTAIFKKDDKDSWTLLSDMHVLDENDPREQWNYAYIDSEINEKFCNDVIFPSLTRPPFQGFQVF